MIVLLYIIPFLSWYIIGLVGSYLVMEFYYRRGKYASDVCLGDLIFFFAMAITGPANLLSGLFFVVAYFIFEKFNTDTIIFRKKSK